MKIVWMLIILLAVLASWYYWAGDEEAFSDLKTQVYKNMQDAMLKVFGGRFANDDKEVSSDVKKENTQDEGDESWAEQWALTHIKLEDKGLTKASNGSMYLRGVLKNGSESRLKFIYISATLYKDGKPVKAPSIFVREIHPSMQPGEELSFDFHFKDPPDFDYYKFKLEEVKIAADRF